MKYSICFFPVVGIICGAVSAAWYTLCIEVHISDILFAIVSTCIPLMITGGIHMDGYMDTVDALASHQSSERKLEILKDSHCGAFAVIYCGVYLMLYFGLSYELYTARIFPVVYSGFVLSRALSAICALNIPNARKNGMLGLYTRNTRRKQATVAMAIVAILACGAMILMSLGPGVVAAIFVIAFIWRYYRLVMKQFGGVTGDTAGFFLQICELIILLGVWLGGQLI